MGYQPGPLLLQTAGNVGIARTVYDFAADVSDQLGELETLPAGWGSFLDDATQLMAEPSDPFPDVDLNAAMLTLHAYSDTESFLGVNAMVTALGEADISLGAAIGYAPAEAWIDTSGAFVPPVPAETLGVPVIPPGAIDFSVVGAVAGTTTQPGLINSPAGITVTFLNLSQYGNANFRVGDDWQVTATGTAGLEVYVYASLNGADIGGGPVGPIGLDNKFVLTGTMGPDQIGVWSEQWWVGTSRIATFNFIVVDN